MSSERCSAEEPASKRSGKTCSATATPSASKGAVTEASCKRMSPQRAADGYRALNEVLVGSDLGSN
jgi:hypothetical protein